jgi:hypothetical protein
MLTGETDSTFFQSQDFHFSFSTLSSLFQLPKTTGSRPPRSKPQRGIFVVHSRRRIPKTCAPYSPTPSRPQCSHPCQIPTTRTIQSHFSILVFDPTQFGTATSAAPRNHIRHAACQANLPRRAGPRQVHPYVRIATVRFRTPTVTKLPQARLNN